MGIGYKGEIMKDTIIVEIRAAEGGDDAKLLVNDQYDIYCKYCALECL
jgi:protein subunit release factor A